ncbi:MAG: C69 family dipeptidase [Bacteroidales bacterium]|jgi:dipeptidase|nr:C69 family dipeptidase [Bacteroidales bacterium]
MKKSVFTVAVIGFAAAVASDSRACTNFLVTRGASADGSVMITYSADSHTLYGELYYFPAAGHKAGELREIVEWDTGKPLGFIPEASETYSVAGNMNEHQVIIGETTFGGRSELVDPTGIIDYGSLIYIALQRSKTAREAIGVMTSLAERYGFCSGGESFSIGDKNEAWIMEMTGKGEGGKGALWVALRIPDGYICAHANQARITAFPKNDPENCLYSKDVISFAREKGWYNGTDEDFSFSDTYNPVDFHGARFCEMRVWSFFKTFNKDMYAYFDYAKGENLKRRMPLWIKPDRRLSPKDVMNAMRDHLEDTELDMRKDLGAGPHGLPYRWRPLTWKANGREYCNERATATQQTGFWFVGQARAWLPDMIGGILWFGVDDAATSPLTPIYSSINQIPVHFAQGNGSMIEYSETSAFWLVNQVANFAYLRYDVMGKDVCRAMNELEDAFLNDIAATDTKAVNLYKKSPAKARKYLTEYSGRQATAAFQRWKDLSRFLLVKYIDGNIKKEQGGKFVPNRYHTTSASPDQPGYPEWWLEEIAENTGNKLMVNSE